MTIAIVTYRDSWPAEFLQLAARIRQAVGSAALAIHHIGSTAVPGLAAKDVLDIQVTVANLGQFLDPAVIAIGFTSGGVGRDHCPPGLTLADPELAKRFYRLELPRVNLHVREEGRFNQRYALLFRDYLRAEPHSAAAYAEIKGQLARYFPEDVDAYYDLKDPVCDVIMAGARAWAIGHDWHPGPTEA